MKICVAQIKSSKGNVAENIKTHKAFIALAVKEGVELIIFPELSLTGYEPELAEQLATGKDDKRLDDFKALSNAHGIIIGIGMPVKSDNGLHIGMIVFQPGLPRELYTKQYLHEDEYPYFTPGNDTLILKTKAGVVALAICYELSVEQHAKDANQNGAQIYLASVAKTKEGMDKAISRLSEIASGYQMTVLLANSTGPSDNFISGGRSSVWNSAGALIGQLDETGEGLLILDTLTQNVTQKHYNHARQ